MIEVKRTERGWGGHFICADRCLFRRNTLLEKDGVFVVVSTVGNLYINGELKEIGHQRFCETMAFYSDESDDLYHDADVSKEISFDSKWCIDRRGTQHSDNEVNDMHEAVVDELTGKLMRGEL